jgi:peptidoglycan/xylan/chitin deacetylase (PgdA/CDA1 family)
MEAPRVILRRAAAGLPGRIAERLAGGGPAVAVLLYHRVVARRGRDPWSLAVGEANFRAQILALRDRWPVLALADALDGLDRGALPSKHVVALTFDDGYRDNLTRAKGALDELGLTATLFLATSFAASGLPFWWDRLDALPEGDDDRHRAARRMTGGSRDPWLNAMGAPRTLADPEAMPLTAEEIRGLVPTFRLAAHGHDHLSLGLAAPHDAAHDLTACWRALLRLAPEPLRMLAYPFGGPEDVTDVAVAAATDAGFTTAFTTSRGVVRSGAERLRLPRIWVHDGPAESLLAAVTRAFL